MPAKTCARPDHEPREFACTLITELGCGHMQGAFCDRLWHAAMRSSVCWCWSDDNRERMAGKASVDRLPGQEMGQVSAAGFIVILWNGEA